MNLKFRKNPLNIKAIPSSYILNTVSASNSNLYSTSGDLFPQSKNQKNLSLNKLNHGMIHSSSLPNLTEKQNTEYSIDYPLQSNSPPHPHSPPPNPPSLLHEKFDQLFFFKDSEEITETEKIKNQNQNESRKEKNIDYDSDYSINENELKNRDDNYNVDNYQHEIGEDGEEEEDREEEEETRQNYINSLNKFSQKSNKLKHSFKKSYSLPVLKIKKEEDKQLHLNRPTLNSSNHYIKNNWNEIKDNKINFKKLEKQIMKRGVGNKPTGRKTYIDDVIKENTQKPEYYYKNYLTETFGEERKHLVQNYLDQFKQKLNQNQNDSNPNSNSNSNPNLENKISINGINININKYGDVNTSQTKKAIKYISNRVATKVTTVQPFENQYNNLISLQDPNDYTSKDNKKKIIPGISYIPRAKKVINKDWLASLEIKPPTIEEV